MEVLQNRVPPPLVTVIIGVAMALMVPELMHKNWPSPSITGLESIFFAGSAIFGIPALFAFFKAKTTIDPIRIERASQLVTTGIYGFTRNPMYVSMLLLLCGWAAYLGRPGTWLGPIEFFLFISRFQIAPEERFLLSRFGQSYTDYCLSVRRWL